MSNLAAQELQSFVRRIESVEDEINALNSDKSEIYKEAKGRGYTNKTIRKVVAARRMDAAERDEQDAEFELYWNAVHGIDPDHVRAHVEIIEEFDAETGEITEPQVAPQPVQTTEPLDVNLSDPQWSGAATRKDAVTAAPLLNAGSSKGRTAEFDSANAGSTPVPASTVATFVAKSLRPYCLNTAKCGGQGRKHCWSCQKAHDEQQGVA